MIGNQALNLFLKNKDTSVFEDEELFEIYEMILLMGQTWCEKMQEFEKEFPKSAKIKTKSKWETKYYELCFKSRKANKSNLNSENCEILFNTISLCSIYSSSLNNTSKLLLAFLLFPFVAVTFFLTFYYSLTFMLIKQ